MATAATTSLGEVLRRRIATQRLAADKLPDATEVVRLLTAVQAQDFGHALWSLGLRTAGLDAAAVRAEFDAGRFLRTHVLRPTWHLVAAEDLRWILAVTAPRVQQLNWTQYRRLGLDQAMLDRGVSVIADALAARGPLTRPEIATHLAADGLPSQGQHLAYLVMNAELEAVICSGAIRGAQQTYALFESRTPRAADRPGDAAELLRRYVHGHGPTSIRDFTRWSSLTLKLAGEALGQVAEGLASVQVAGTELWYDPAAPGAASASGALLVPLYDELTLSYPAVNFPVADRHPQDSPFEVWLGSVILDETNVGLWRRTVRGPTVAVEIDLAPGVSATAREAAAAAAEQLAAFLGLRLELTVASR
jgi:hypothetical protein